MLSTETLSASTGSPVPVQVAKTGRRLRLLLVVGALVVALSIGFEAWRVVLGPNVHVTVPGKVYRGAQPTAAGLEALAARYHIRTVVNLRGPCDPADWFVEEIKATQRLQMSQEDICM